MIIFISGCISSSGTKTFSDGNMSFNYPDSFRNITPHNSNNKINLPGGDITTLQGLIILGNSNFTDSEIIIIFVGKNVIKTSAPQMRDEYLFKAKNLGPDKNNVNISSITTETNPNNVVVEKFKYTIVEPYNGTLRYDRFSEMFFEVHNVVYGILLYGPESKQQEITDITNIIFKSIK